jgi:hypothetical protein
MKCSLLLFKIKTVNCVVKMKAQLELLYCSTDRCLKIYDPGKKSTKMAEIT